MSTCGEPKHDKGGIAHAQLSLGGGMIMLGSVADTPLAAI